MIENLSPEVNQSVAKLAQALGTSEAAVVDNMCLQFLAERGALVARGLAGSELDAFPRESDGALMSGRDLFIYAGVMHTLRLKRILAAEVQLNRMTAGVDTIYMMVRQQVAFFQKTWAAMRGKLEALNLAVPSLLESEIANMQRTASLTEKLATEIEKTKAAMVA